MHPTKCLCRTLYLVIGMLVVCCSISAQDQNPCAGAQRRALIFSGGGTKGAFETGAAYHLIVHRNCDFHEFAGASVGALNSAFLAQALPSDDASQSHATLAGQVESLVSLWQSVKGPRDIVRSRKFATLRFGLFGLENLNDFQPLKRLLQVNISAEKLAQGRPTRAGVVSFWDGGYHEVVARSSSSLQVNPKFMEYLFASSVPPLYGKLPRIVDGSASDDPRQWPQFTDGGLRHITPVVSYFKTCRTEQFSGADNSENCNTSGNFIAPPHEAVQQLFVIVSSPYSRQSDLMPVHDPKCCRPGTRQITDGRKILGRTITMLDDSAYRWDLDFMFMANDMLRWRWQNYQDAIALTAPDSTQAQRPQNQRGFGIESYNRDANEPGAPSLPYEIALVTPEKEYADVSQLLVFSPSLIQEQLYCGCIAADRMMQDRFAQSSTAGQCAHRFPPLIRSGKHVIPDSTANWGAQACEQLAVDVTENGTHAPANIDRGITRIDTGQTPQSPVSGFQSRSN